jgi:uncharacterized protein YmfQ (DUF2313 family)
MPSLPERSAADYLAALKALLPTGAVWPRDAGSSPVRVLQGVATSVARLRARADALLVDAYPSTTYELLPEWEATLGLPDPCAGGSPSLPQRQQQVAAQLTAQGGQSVAYFIGQAKALGFEISITQFAVARIGAARIGEPVNGEAWAHAWRVVAPAQTVTLARIGASGIGDPLASWGNAVLTCALSRLRPAHTVLQIGYGE